MKDNVYMDWGNTSNPEPDLVDSRLGTFGIPINFLMDKNLQMVVRLFFAHFTILEAQIDGTNIIYQAYSEKFNLIGEKAQPPLYCFNMKIARDGTLKELQTIQVPEGSKAEAGILIWFEK